jgi:hypothetical protein
MNKGFTIPRRRTATMMVGALLAGLVSSLASAQEKLREPVYRVAAEASTSTTAPSASATAVAAAPASRTPFDLTKQDGEHPLMLAIRALKTSQQTIDESIRDYSCTLIKRERVDGQLGEPQHIAMKVAHSPFSVYMYFKQPFAGREVVYVAGQNENKLVALDVGVKRYLGKMSLDPEGALAMKGQRHPITSVGIRNLTAKLLRVFEEETKYAECDVTTNSDTKINSRPATLVQIIHPTPRQNFHAHVTRIFFDNELRVPIHYDAFSWPPQEGAKPPLEESYTYQSLKINNNFTAIDFDPNNNPNIFK